MAECAVDLGGLDLPNGRGGHGPMVAERALVGALSAGAQTLARTNAAQAALKKVRERSVRIRPPGRQRRRLTRE
jgi:hypothetical protein